MKRLALALTLAVSLGFSACSKGERTVSAQAQGSAAATETANRAGKGHPCGAITKKGTPCTRRVAEGKDRCWQHDGQH